MAEKIDMDKAVQAFTTSSLAVIKQMTKCKVKTGKTYVKERFYPSYDCSFIIGGTGKFEGAVTMSLQEKTAFFLASAMWATSQ